MTTIGGPAVAPSAVGDAVGTSLTTLASSLPAIGLALVAAGCFVVGASLQHSAVGGVTAEGTGRLSSSALRTLVTRPRWLLGMLTAGAGALMHAVALVLSPVSIVQPIGVLAVPIAVLFTMRRTGRRPGRAVVVGVALSVLGVGAFVVIAASNTVVSRVPDFATLIGGASCLVLVAVLVGAATVAKAVWARCVAWACAGAVAFGLVSALVRAVSQQVRTGLAEWYEPRILATVVGIGLAMAVGAWLVQQGFATGAPEVVIACLTVVDPMVAVLLGILLLGEGPATTGTAVVALLACAVAATAGVISLASHHPDAERARETSDPVPDPATRPASPQ